MIKKLRFKFVLLSMSALLLVLAAIIAGINLVNYRSILEDVDEILEILSENRGTFPDEPGEGPGKKPPGKMSRELPYETRYFSVVLDSETGSLIQVDTSRIVSVDRKEAIELAQDVLEEERKIGFADEFRYIVKEDGRAVQVVFLDCGRKLESFRQFLWASIGISLLGYIVVFFIIAFFSGRLIRPISESYEKQKRFITDAGHEIKTPLTIINADASVLEMEFGKNEWLEDIEKQTKRLTALTNDLVRLSRMEESGSSMQMIDFPFSDVVSETAASFQHLAQTQKKEFQYAIQPMLSLHGDEKSIKQLLNILLDNAIKYSPEGGIIRLTAEKQKKSILLSVFNTTETAVPTGKLPQLFERFYRMDSSRNSQTGGYGIGLSVAKVITEAHNGKIQAKSEDGHSLQITVSFPLIL